MSKFLDKLVGFGKGVSSAVSPFLGIASGIGSLFGNKNIDKQIRAQQEENQKNRDWNLMLAQMQNQWSQDQWERENEYNTPINQRKRLQDAGLNADLMYGNGGISNIAASSPSMTSGQGSQPVDVSALGRKATIGDMIQQGLQTRMAEAQIKATEAQARKTAADAGMSESELNVRRTLESMFGDIDSIIDNTEVYHNPLVQRELANTASVIQEWKNKVAANRGISADSLMKAIESQFKEQEVRAIVKDLKNKASISESEAEFMLKTIALRIAGFESEVSIAKDNAAIASWLNSQEGLGEFGANMIRFLKYIIKDIPILK